MSEPIRILHVVPCLGVGGLELGLLRIVRAMTDGFEHSVVCLKPPCSLAEQFPAGVRIHMMDSPPREIRLPLRLRKVIRQERPDIIHARNFSAWPDVAVANRLLPRRNRAKLIFAFHGFQVSGQLPLRYRLAMRALAGITDRIFTVSQAARELLVHQARLKADRVGVIPDGIDTDVFSPGPDRPAAGRLVVGAVGSLTPTKNHALLLEAAARLVRDGLDLEIRIAGEGPQRGNLLAQSEKLGLTDRVCLAGNVTDVAGFLRELDLFVMPSRTEALPNAMLEAMSCGLACVATRVGGIAEVLEPTGAGLTVPSEDPAALADGLLSLLNDPARRGTMGQAGRQCVIDRYGMDKMVQSYRELYAELAQERREANRPRVIMLGPLPPPGGGMATVLCNLRDSDLAGRTRLTVMHNGKITRPEHSPLAAALVQLSLLGRLSWNILRRRCQVLHIHTCSGSIFWRDGLHLALGRLLFCQGILHIHGGYFGQFIAGQGRFGRAILRGILRLAAAIIVLDEEALRQFRPLASRRRWLVVPNGVPVPPERRNGHGGRVSFLFMGNLNFSKGADDVVSAAEIARGRGFAGTVLLAGPEGQAGKLRQLQSRIREAGMETCVHLLGVIEGPEKEQVLAEADGFLLPSYGEALPMSLLEAMARGLPAVLTPVGAIPAVARDGQEALFVQPGDVKALAEKMLLLAGDPELRRRLGQAGRQRVCQRYSMERMVEQVSQLYQEVLERRGAKGVCT